MRVSAILLVAVVACSRSAPATDSAVVSSASALVPTSGEMLDREGDHVLSGDTLPAPPDADARRQLRLSLDGKRIDGTYLDARLFPGRDDRLIVIDERGRLVDLPLKTGHPRIIDEQVEAGFDASAACSCIVYVRGEAPDGVLVRAPLSDGAPAVLASEVSPAWLPVISPDGREVAFASGRGGFASWWVMPLAGGAPTQLTNVGATAVDGLVPVAEGPDRPVWAGGLLVFANGDTTYAVRLDGKLRAWKKGFGAPHWYERGKSLSFGNGPARILPNALYRLAP